MTDAVTLFHGPNSRSTGVLTLLEELGAPYELKILNLRAGENRAPAFLAVNPLGKVPAILHRGALVTEQVAIYIYLADAFPAAGLAPAIGDPLRGPYLRWLAVYGSAYEPALIDRALKREPGALAMSPYGSFDAVMGLVNQTLASGPYLLGDRMSAADVLWGTALGWGVGFGMVEATPAVSAYVERLRARPATVRAGEIDARHAPPAAAPAT